MHNEEKIIYLTTYMTRKLRQIDIVILPINENKVIELRNKQYNNRNAYLKNKMHMISMTSV